jgi:Fe-S-cluster containining protein
MRKLFNRCMGECCEDIGLSYSPEDLKNSYQIWVASRDGHTSGVSMMKSEKNVQRWAEIWLLYPMLTFARADKRHPESPYKDGESIVYHYTCKHFNEKTRLCDIYEERPYMCRVYGENGHICRNPRCRCKAQYEKRKKADREAEIRNKKKLMKAPREICDDDECVEEKAHEVRKEKKTLSKWKNYYSRRIAKFFGRNKKGEIR